MSLAAKFRRKVEVAEREIAGESFLIPICGSPVDMENIFVLNPLGDFIWQRLDGETPLDEIIADITTAFDVDSAQARGDVRQFMETLERNHLVEEVR